MVGIIGLAIFRLVMDKLAHGLDDGCQAHPAALERERRSDRKHALQRANTLGRQIQGQRPTRGHPPSKLPSAPGLQATIAAQDGLIPVLPHAGVQIVRRGPVPPQADHVDGQALGVTVYVVRLRGHGTSPYDLHTRVWQDWYEAVLRGYSCLQAWSRWQFAGGMSTGGALALYLAAQGIGPLQGVFAVGTPLTLQRRWVRLASVVQTVRDFIRDEPENLEANYAYHPLQGVRQLLRFIEIYQAVLPHVTVPVLLIQARGNTDRKSTRLNSSHSQISY